MFCKNKVEDFDKWLAVFGEELANNESAGLTLERMWQDPTDPNTVFFLLLVEDQAKADAYMASPHAAEIGKQAGAIDGEIQYLRPV